MRCKRLCYLTILLLPVIAWSQPESVVRSGQSRAHWEGEPVDGGDVGYPLKGFAAYTNTGTPTEGMKIEVFVIGRKEPIAVTTTDSNGNFFFPHLQEGRYKLRNSKPGWSTDVIPIRVTRKSKDFIDICTEILGPPFVLDCDELRSQVTRELIANGVKTYTLEIVDKNEAAEGTIVGTCDAGTKRIVYTRRAAKTEALMAPAAKPNK